MYIHSLQILVGWPVGKNGYYTTSEPLPTALDAIIVLKVLMSALKGNAG